MGKKATKKEVQERVDVIIKLMAMGMRSSAIVQDATVKSWGITERNTWKYVEKALKYFQDKSNIDRDGELGKILEQYEFLYKATVDEADYRAAAQILDKRADLIGLKKIEFEGNIKHDHRIIVMTAVPRPPEAEEPEEAPEEGEEPKIE